MVAAERDDDRERSGRKRRRAPPNQKAAPCQACHGPNGNSTNLGQLAMANFANPQGLQQLGNQTWAQTNSSGQAVMGLEPVLSALNVSKENDRTTAVHATGGSQVARRLTVS